MASYAFGWRHLWSYSSRFVEGDDMQLQSMSEEERKVVAVKNLSAVEKYARGPREWRNFIRDQMRMTLMMKGKLSCS